ncbi:hypothetical protein ASPSYDRAFT_1122681 [Aspergillus sydowii CBS 593.65]|uniref:Uncharacterized protein n=1 Tax=Aspergillus sydowii CBS 593.65 TaxID=1036612 RepID=A0A1L9TCI2_9EURO|nr:uncharacterized protein ASPSYDRAFT_1122681 [Aspergillus sydowii CBS 593.65]OJJ57140.1 hypothetical protein ASPSYDRAFT_1122681 [Aspergillus sydowii CBS 593.65]
MRSSTLLAVSLPVLSAHAWTITWRNADGEESTRSGHGPSKCIPIDHAQGQEFDIDGEGEPNINMLLFTNSKCSGDPSGQATVSFVKEASTDLSGFQVVRQNGGDDDDSDDGDDEEGTTTSTGSGSSSGSATPSPTSTSTDDDDDDDDETFTLPTAPSSSATGTENDETPSPSESGDDGTPTDGSAQLGLSRTGLAGVVVAAVAGGWALDLLF